LATDLTTGGKLINFFRSLLLSSTTKVFLKSANSAKVIAKIKMARFIHPQCNNSVYVLTLLIICMTSTTIIIIWILLLYVMQLTDANRRILCFIPTATTTPQRVRHWVDD